MNYLAEVLGLSVLLEEGDVPSVGLMLLQELSVPLQPHRVHLGLLLQKDVLHLATLASALAKIIFVQLEGSCIV